MSPRIRFQLIGLRWPRGGARPDHLVTKRTDCIGVAWHAVVGDGRRGRGQGSGGRPRRLAAQAVAAAQPVWPWTLADIDAGWFLLDLPEAGTVTPQVELFGPDDRAPGPCDLRVGERWLSFATESEAAIVSLLLNADLVPALAILPGGPVASRWLPRVTAWIADLGASVRSHVDDRIPPDDPSSGDAQLMAWSIAISGLRDAALEMAEGAAVRLPLLRHVRAVSS